MMTVAQDDAETAGALAEPVAVPVLVGVTGKRRSRLRELGVAEAQVRAKLVHTFDLLEALTPHSPKLLLCGMADGVDEIAAKLVIEAADGKPEGRRFPNWSVVGLLPLPEAALLDDFPASEGRRWWYHELDAAARRHVRMMPLETLTKRGAAAACGADAQGSYTADELRRLPGQSNSARTAHYEQLALVLAERSTVLIAVMPEAEVPDRLGGTAQVVAHRLNGWRADWPPPEVTSIAAASEEFVVPPALATSGSRDVWLVPIGAAAGDPHAIDLRLLHGREETEAAWPQPLQPAPGATSLAERILASLGNSAMRLWRGLFGTADRDVLIRGGGRPLLRRAMHSDRAFKVVETFNRLAATVATSHVPLLDQSVAASPTDPGRGSAIAAAERLRRTLSDVQVVHKRSVRRTIAALGMLAWISILILEVYLDLQRGPGTRYAPYLPLSYVLIVGLMIFLFELAHSRSWAAVTEDYRMVAEALRVQIAWWHFGLIARRERVDQHALRYDTGEFQLLRQSLSTVLDAIGLRHAALPRVMPAQRLPGGVEDWIGVAGPPPSGQLRYQYKTAADRKRIHNLFEFLVWGCFGVALGMAVWLTAVALDDAAQTHAVDWLIRFALVLGFAFWFAVFVVHETFEGRPESVTSRRLRRSLMLGIPAATAFVALGQIEHWDPVLLHKILGTMVLLLLAGAGTLKYVSEKIGIEAEAQNAAEASINYARARRALDQIDRELDAKLIDIAEANRRRERIVRDLGQYALTETESWLRSHRERPLHPPVGS